MKILFVFDSLSPIGGGSQVAILNYLKQLPSTNVEFMLLTSSRSQSFLRSINFSKDKLILNSSINLSFLFPEFHPSLLLSTHATQEILAFKPDIIQLNEPSMLDLGFINLAKKHHIRIVGFYHTEFGLFHPRHVFETINAYRNRILRKVDAILCPSTVMMKKIQRLFLDKTIVKVPYPVDDVYFQPIKNKSSNSTHLLYVGRLSPEKKIPFIFSVMQKLPEMFRLTIVGDGKDREELTKRAEIMNIAKRVHFAGLQNPVSICQLLSSTFLTIYPSVTETFGLVYIESLASGVPVIVADYPTSREIIPQDTSIFMHSTSPIDWAKEIMNLKNNQRHYQQMQQAIKKHYPEFSKYQSRQATEALVQTYQSIIQEV